MILSVILTVFSCAKISYSSYLSNSSFSNYIIFRPVIDKLFKNGVDTDFVAAIVSDGRTNFNDKYVKINVLGYLNKDNYSNNFTRKAIRQASEFFDDYGDQLIDCEKKFGVPKEVITAILWIETKHGTYLGNNHIVSVFLSAAMADRPEFINMNINSLKESFDGDSSQLQALEDNIRKRAVKKAQWAMNELKALDEIYHRGNNRTHILDLRGSWAGAFGISQFLPSSYLKWGVDGNGDGVIDLYNPEDAIYSVGNYLSVNGWGSTIDSQKKAIFQYNNSDEYVNAVLVVAYKLKIANAWRYPIDKQINEKTDSI